MICLNMLKLPEKLMDYGIRGLLYVNILNDCSLVGMGFKNLIKFRIKNTKPG